MEVSAKSYKTVCSNGSSRAPRYVCTTFFMERKFFKTPNSVTESKNKYIKS